MSRSNTSLTFAREIVPALILSMRITPIDLTTGITPRVVHLETKEEILPHEVTTLVASGKRVTLFKVPGPLANRGTMAGRLPHETTTLVVSGERVTLFKVPGPLANREIMAGQLTEEILPHGTTTLVARGKRVTLFKVPGPLANRGTMAGQLPVMRSTIFRWLCCTTIAVLLQAMIMGLVLDRLTKYDNRLNAPDFLVKRKSGRIGTRDL